MFSKINIQKSLGKDIIFFPFKAENIKENSLNLTVSKLAWTLTLTDVPQDTTEEGESFQQQEFGQARHCYVTTKDGKDYIILAPFSTTMVITNEFLATGKSIGGTIHTRVSTAALGVGHISTMIGPSYMAKLCVPLHNPTCKPIYLPVGDQFLSIIFHRLSTSIKEPNHTSKAHIDKFAKWRINLTDEQHQEIFQENLKDMKNCVAEMNKSETFRIYKKEHSWKKCFLRTVKDWASPRNVIILVIFILAILIFIVSFFPGEQSSINTWAIKSRETLMTAILLLGIQLIPNER
ncbi:dCTP deaminase domain-containing protein [Prevotella histicola]|uniref:Uncharacterized protein n=1 Tax=Prevotella histicola F0411 TaxID=857291 RepID=G6AK08_9BACT|nr:hypothetical protein [Prevotella histicola]EHG14988.1 hypothetical protein HMPREF9138_02435 [Prevotella histicola F0411]QUB84736.1 hypothetical protein J5A62_10850 [Prevotella histicola]